VLSIEAYERICGKYELYRLIDEGLADMEAGRTRPFDEVMGELREEFGFA
jgi:predicted transcriptional regulator